jgi:S-DNA-T family DNA segregation ATPase FtsK/SpoIIIE
MLFQAPIPLLQCACKAPLFPKLSLISWWIFGEIRRSKKLGRNADIAVFASQSRQPLVDDQVQAPLWEETGKHSDEDPLTTEVIRIIRHEGRASVSLLQRKLRIGYSRSARINESLEEKGIGPPNPQTGTREVLDYGEFGPLHED